MDKSTLYETCGNYINRLFENVSRNGDWFNFSCPIAPYSPDHKYKNDRMPSAGAIVLDNGKVYWHCFTCKGHGPLTNLLRYLETKKNVSYTEIINKLDSSDYFPDYEDRFLSTVKRVCEPLEFSDIFEPIENYPEASKYIADRGVSPTTAKKLALQYDPDNYRIVFPVKDIQGRLYGFTGRAIKPDDKVKIKDYYFPKSQFLLGQEHWCADDPTIIVEGLFAFAHLHEITKGKYFPYNITAIMGSSVSSEQIRLLLEFGKPVYCLLDNDPPGQIGMWGRKPAADWSPKKIELEKQKGLIHALKSNIPTFILKWPSVNGVPKDDPDSLTFDELSYMISHPRLILGG
jgi:hypothetical protein